MCTSGAILSYTSARNAEIGPKGIRIITTQALTYAINKLSVVICVAAGTV